jgi:peptide/nickel transport system substrate-binding protein
MSREDFDRRSFLQYGGAAAATAASVGLAGCPTDGNGDGTDDFEVTVTQGNLTGTLDPTGDLATPHLNIISQAYEPFLYRDADGKPIELIVSDWERTGDNQVTLTVRDDVTFHSGNDMTPEDVAFSIERANESEDFGGPLGDISEANVEDGDVVVELNRVEPAIFRQLSTFGFVMEQAWVEENDVATNMNGTGPYELDEFVEDTRVTFTRFDDYWGETPDVSGGEFNAAPEDSARIDRLIGGDTDLIVNVPPNDITEIRDSDGVDTEFVPSTRIIFLVHNDVKEPFDSEAFRQAMNYAVDVDSIINSILNEFGDKTAQPTLPGHTGHNPDVEPYPYDPDEAEQLVEDSGYAGTEITLHTPTGRYLRDVDIAETAAAQIDELPNVTCDVERRTFAELVGEIATPDPQDAPAFYLIGWGNPTFDANYTLNPFMAAEEGPFRYFHDEEIATLVRDANNMPDGEERTSKLQEANRLANEKAAWTYLHQQYSIYGTSDRIDWSARQDEDIHFQHMDRA